MTIEVVGRTWPGTEVLCGIVLVLAAALTVGFLTGMPMADVPLATAAVCQRIGNTACAPGDLTYTSVLAVMHFTDPGYATQTVVEPDTGETWRITAQWCPPGSAGQDYTEVAYVTVRWSGSAWVTSNVQTTNGINAIGICQGDTCDAGGANVHGWNYKLIVDVDNQADAGKNLTSVAYQTTSVDDGYLVMDPTQVHGYCYLGSSVSPTSQSWSSLDAPADWGIPSRCAYNCTMSGASVTIYYN